MIRVIIDSATDINQQIIDLYGDKFDFIPLSVIMDGKSYTDRVDVTLQEVHNYMKDGNMPKTSQISPQAAIDKFTEIAEAGDDAIYISLSSALSGPYQVGMNALREVQEEYPDFKGAIIDSKSAAGLLTILYVQAQELIKADVPFDEIVELLNKQAEHGVTFLCVDDLNWLAKGGRLPKAIGTIGSMLKVKPFLSLDDNGEIIKEALVRGKDRVYTKMIEKSIDLLQQTSEQIVVVSHVGRVEIAEKIKASIKEAVNATILITEISPVTAAHIGIGGAGVFFLNHVPNEYRIPNALKH